MQIAYVLSSSTGDGLHAASTRVSIASVRLTNPAAEIVLVCDARTAEALERLRHPVLDEVDRLVVAGAPADSDTLRNRLLKTRLRELLTGPVLYLDSDTFVQGRLASLFDLQCDIAAVPNASGDRRTDQMWHRDQHTLSDLGWSIRPDIFVNGGVLLLQDTRASHDFARLLRTKYLESVRKTASLRDQPALNSALAESRVHFVRLPHCFNAQFRMRADVARSAIILHFYSSWPNPKPTRFDQLISGLLAGEPLRLDVVRYLVARKMAWKPQVVLQETVLGRVFHRAQFWAARGCRL